MLQISSSRCGHSVDLPMQVFKVGNFSSEIQAQLADLPVIYLDPLARNSESITYYTGLIIPMKGMYLLFSLYVRYVKAHTLHSVVHQPVKASRGSKQRQQAEEEKSLFHALTSEIATRSSSSGFKDCQVCCTTSNLTLGGAFPLSTLTVHLIKPFHRDTSVHLGSCMLPARVRPSKLWGK